MKKQRSTFFLFMCGWALFLSACGNVEVDNAAPQSVTLQVGEHTLDLAPGAREQIKLPSGDHALRISTKAGEALADTTIRVREGGLINAGGTHYLIWRDLYGLQKNRGTLLNEEWVEMDSVEYFGDFKQIGPEQVYVESTWTYGLNESFPVSKNLMIFKDFVLESKVFRQSEFVTEYNQRVGQTD